MSKFDFFSWLYALIYQGVKPYQVAIKYGADMSASHRVSIKTDIDQKIAMIAKEIRDFLGQVEAFYHSLTKFHLVRKVMLHKQKTRLLGRFYSEYRDIYIPKFYWVDYVGENRRYLDWEWVSDILNATNATLDERILHIKMNYEFARINLEAKSHINRLKDMISLSEDLTNMMNSQNVTLKMLKEL